MNFKSYEKIENIISQKELKEYLTYDPESGLFRWRYDGKNQIKSGQLAGTFRKNTKLIYIMIKGNRYRADKLAFLYMTGIYPDYEIHHKNGARFINSWDNLEMERIPEITNYDEKQNVIRGVTKDANYKVLIYSDGGKHYLGSYVDFDEAVCVRYAAEQACYGEMKSPAQKYVKENIQGE